MEDRRLLGSYRLDQAPEAPPVGGSGYAARCDAKLVGSVEERQQPWFRVVQHHLAPALAVQPSNQVQEGLLRAAEIGAADEMYDAARQPHAFTLGPADLNSDARTHGCSRSADLAPSQ